MWFAWCVIDLGFETVVARVCICPCMRECVHYTCTCSHESAHLWESGYSCSSHVGREDSGITCARVCVHAGVCVVCGTQSLPGWWEIALLLANFYTLACRRLNRSDRLFLDKYIMLIRCPDILWSVLWFIVWIIFCWPVSFVVAFVEVFIVPFCACIDGAKPVCEVLDKVFKVSEIVCANSNTYCKWSNMLPWLWGEIGSDFL